MSVVNIGCMSRLPAWWAVGLYFGMNIRVSYRILLGVEQTACKAWLYQVMAADRKTKGLKTPEPK